MGYLIQCSDFSIAKRVIREFFVLLLVRYETTAPQSLLNLCQTHSFEEFEEQSIDNEEEEQKDTNGIIFGEEDDVIADWLSDITLSVEDAYTDPFGFDDKLSVYYDPSRKEYFMRIFSTIYACGRT